MFSVDSKKFEEMVLEAIEEVPDKFKDKFENLGIIINETDLARKMATTEKDTSRITLGLYEGSPLPIRPGSIKHFPDKITIFKKSIESVCSDENMLRKTVRRVVLHEIGHYFGLSEKKLRDLGY
jgi:predicted Zn-dependent protease with MMP-like domain